MKKTFCLIIWLMVAIGFSTVCHAKSVIELKAVQFLNIGNPGEQGFHLLIDTINDAAKGELVIKLAGGPESIPPRKQPESVRLGAVDMAFFPCDWYAPIVQEAAIMKLVRLTPWEARESGWFDYLVEKHKAAGMRFIGTADVIGPFNMYSKEPIKNMEGLRGKRFRHTPTYVWFKDLGLTPVTTGNAEIYTALERNLLEGFATKIPSVAQFHLYDVCKYIIGPQFWPHSSVVTIMNEKKFQSLPNHLQALILESQKKAEKPMYALRDELYSKTWKTLMENGMQHIEWSPEESKAFLDKIDELTFKARTKGISSEELARIKKMMGY